MENSEICSACGGACCKARSGHIFPDEFGLDISKEFLEGLLLKGTYAIDWWGDSPSDNRIEASRLFFLRLKHKGIEKILDNSKMLPCILLNENGCSLSHNERPRVCQALIPKDNFQCSFENDQNSEIECAIAWQKYQPIIIEILKEMNEL